MFIRSGVIEKSARSRESLKLFLRNFQAEKSANEVK